MNGNGLKEIKEADKRTALNREFPGESCGNAECENLCAGANEIAKMLHINPQEMVNHVIRREILPKYHCISGEGVTRHFCRFGFASPGLRESVPFSEDERKIIGKKYITDADASESGACKECLKNANKVFRWPKEAHLMPKLPIHPNCKCHYENVYESLQKARPISSLDNLIKLIQTLREIWKTKIPKPPRMTAREGIWMELVWDWFFEQGPNPVYFDKNSPYSKDISNSYSMKILRKNYEENGKIPRGWSFIGPDTAKYVLGEVEWFIGSYEIRNFKKVKDVVTFTVYNKSSWHSGTRLPKSWTNYIEEKTGYHIEDLVTSAPRGKTLQSKVKSLIPRSLLQNSFTRVIIEGLLNELPSFGGDWEQYYEIEAKWEKK